MKRIITILKGRYGRKVIIYLLTCCLVFNTSLPALLASPKGGTPDIWDGGGASITYKTGPYGHTTLVNVDTTRTIINWESLDTKGGAIDVRETLAFTQGSLTNSAVLNRVSGPATQFNGDLVAPGMRIFMVNPAGIVFGSGSTVNVMQLVASGLNMSNDAFKAYLSDPVNKKMVFSGGNGNVTSSTNISADSVFLIGKKVYNAGQIVANEGLVVMAAGDEVRLYENGSDVSVVVSGPGDGDPDIWNSNTINADNGKIVLAAGDTFSRAIRNVSTIAASGGEVSLKAAQIENNGLISVSSTGDGDGGSVSLTGTESVKIGPDGLGTGGNIEANAGPNGNGGSVTIQTNGLFRMDENSSITAAGGSVSGNGGSVTITCDDFEIPGDISPLPGNKTEEPGKLEINTQNVIIADGANVGETDTLYEQDIEALSQGAGNLIVKAQEGITVKDITDGEITGQFGDIELHATGADSALTFADNTDTIRTTLGDIVIEAGSGGIYVGNLTTGKDLSDERPAPGQILLTTNNGGNITTGDLLIRTGWGLAKIDAKSSGNLTVNGDVIVGSESDVLNVPNGQNAHAGVYLSAADNVELNGNMGAYAQGVDDDITEGDKTIAEVKILADTNLDTIGNVLINGDIVADAQPSSQGVAEAAIDVHAGGNVTLAEGAKAYAMTNSGDGGSVTIHTDGLFRMEENSSITTSGLGDAGKGGSVTITCNEFEILGEISASPGNKIEDRGKLEINTLSDVFIADGANAGATNTLYEDDIETLSQSATNLIVNSKGDITVQNITDAIGNGEITGQFGDIELHATGNDSTVTFEDNTDTIRTTLGDIIIEAGIIDENVEDETEVIGINIGNLTTGKYLSDHKPAPGRISLYTTNGGDIITRNLTIEDGWGHAEINVDSSSDLTVNGDVSVGSGTWILNVADQRAAEAVIKLKAENNVVLNGNVESYAYGIEADTSTTKAYIDIMAGGNAEINGDLIAQAETSSSGTADAVVKVGAFGDIIFAEGATAYAIADGREAEAGPGTESEEDTSPDGDHAQIIINANMTPPPTGIPDEFSTPKRDSIVVNVLANDTQEGEPLEGGKINSYTEPTAGSLTEIKQGDIIVSLEYIPPEDLSTLTFDENGKATVTFTYVAEIDGALSEETTVTITLTNSLPAAVKDLAKTFKDQAIDINVLSNDTDLDSGDVLTAVQGAVTPKNGTLVLNENGTFTYTPKKGYLGNDSFTYKVTDGFNTSAEVEVKISVTKVPPVIVFQPFINPAPGLDKIGQVEVEISGCPALAKWVAEELGIDERIIDIWIANSPASTKGIQPYESYSRLRNAALILQDADGSHIAALTQVINELASIYTPPTEEQMAAIAEAIKSDTDEESYYAVANEYLDALVTYVGILSTEMGFSITKSVQIVTDKYISQLAQDQNVGVTAFVSACLAVLRG
jgi:filamentous hemagglutinin family protein